ncbi:hypothetical protein [uncultured Dokdonia sp.]|uniref:hypothetical protein n=1 Tax=uncultured Dokdonia sp. TaxID=575653 RepID=UPI002639B9E6|nr:hypothetical protein [uncultured Dokdonia sp.]
MSTTKPLSRQYLLAPGVKIKSATITNQAAGYFSLTEDGTHVNSVEATGGSNSVAPTAVTFYVYNTEPYSTAHVEIEYYHDIPHPKSTELKTASFTITFKLSGTTYWEQQGSTILPASGNSGTLPIVPPTGNTGAGPETLNKQMVYLLDVSTTGNMLFRGNSPLAGHDQPIDFTTLHNYMKEQYEFQAKGVTTYKPFPNIGEYVLCEVALLSEASETYEIASSIGSYGSQSTQEAIQKQIKAGTNVKEIIDNNLPNSTTSYPADPLTTPTAIKDGSIYAHMYLWQVQPGEDNYDLAHAKQLYKMVHTQQNFKVPYTEVTLPVVYYVHCCNGHDRTGIISSIYMIEKSNKANQATNSDVDLTEQYIRGTTLNVLTANQNGPQLYTNCTYYNGPNKGKNAPNKSRCFLIHAADNPNFVYRKTVEDAYNTIKANDTASAKTINSDAEQGSAATAVYVMDDPSVVPPTS